MAVVDDKSDQLFVQLYNIIDKYWADKEHINYNGTIAIPQDFVDALNAYCEYENTVRPPMNPALFLMATLRAFVTNNVRYHRLRDWIELQADLSEDQVAAYTEWLNDEEAQSNDTSV